MRLDWIEMPNGKQFRYIGSFQENRTIEDNVTHRIKVEWLNWRSAIGVLCDKMMHIKVKFYKTTIRPEILCGSECYRLKSNTFSK